MAGTVSNYDLTFKSMKNAFSLLEMQLLSVSCRVETRSKQQEAAVQLLLLVLQSLHVGRSLIQYLLRSTSLSIRHAPPPPPTPWIAGPARLGRGEGSGARQTLIRYRTCNDCQLAQPIRRFSACGPNSGIASPTRCLHANDQYWRRRTC